MNRHARNTIALLGALAFSCASPGTSDDKKVDPALQQYVLSAVPVDVPNPTFVDFGGKVHLVGYEVTPQGTAAPGSTGHEDTFNYTIQDALLGDAAASGIAPESAKPLMIDAVCSGTTGHAEAVRVVYDPTKTTFTDLLKVFWETHDPTQGMRQGNDVGTQYRSAVYATSEAQRRLADESKAAYETALAARGLGPITTEIAPAPAFYFAEDYHQQYLAKNPNGYCGLGGTGVSCPAGVAVKA